MKRPSRKSQLRLWAKAMALAGLLLLAGCGNPPLSPEERIRQLFDEAEAAVESRDLVRAAGLISVSYKDASQRNYQALRGLLAGYFLRHKSIHLLKQVERLNLQGDRQASAVLYVGVAGQRSQAIESLSQWTGDLIRLELELSLEEDDEWRLSAAQWRRASRGDLLQ